MRQCDVIAPGVLRGASDCDELVCFDWLKRHLFNKHLLLLLNTIPWTISLTINPPDAQLNGL